MKSRQNKKKTPVRKSQKNEKVKSGKRSKGDDVEALDLARFDDDSDNDDDNDKNKSLQDNKKKSKQSYKARGKDEDSLHEDVENNDDDDDSKTPVATEGPLFSDENADWLKPKEKKQLLPDDDEEDHGDNDDDDNDDDGDDVDDDDDDDDDEEEEDNGGDRQTKRDREHDGDDDDDDDDDGDEDDNDDNDDLLEIERESRRIDMEMEAEKQEAEEEMRRTISQQTSIYHLPTSEELEKETDRVIPPSEVRSHVDSILEVLAEFKDRRESGRSRKDYLQVLCHFLSELYGYLPELVEHFLSMFGPPEAVEFIDASDKPRPLVIRTNTLKVRRKDLAASLIKRGVSLDPLANWSKVGLKIIDSPVPIGATPEYLGGQYMLQSAASMCPVLSLGPEPNEKILDISAAPGGKTSYIAQLMKNTGVLFANDLKKERQKATVANMHRLGVKNVITCTHDGRKLGVLFKNRFDRILLDAPCSGLGVISRDPSVKVQRTMADVLQCAHLQKELLLSAIDALKYKGTSGGILVYSTCSVSIIENEEVINFALSKRDIRLVDTGLEFGSPGYTRYLQKRFHSSIALTRRFYPHVHNMDGFYVAKIEKLSDKRAGVQAQVGGEDEEAKPTEGAKQEEQEVGVTEKNEGKEGNDAKIEGKEGNGVNEDDKEETKKRSLQISIPPKKTNAKKQRQNAKVTKPRRLKKSDGM